MGADPVIAGLPLSNAGWNLKDSRKNLDSTYSNYRAVVVGGGTGAPVSIKTLLAMGVRTSAVVAMADNGGSTGLIRENVNIAPPGDIRKCIAAMAADSSSPMVEAFKYRFDFAYNHTLGNLMLTALADVSSFTTAIDVCENILHCLGNVYPSTLDSVNLDGRTRDGRVLHGQSTIVHSDTALESVWLTPDDPEPYKPALEAIRKADLIVLGPGSLFTSIIPNLLVPGVIDAIRQSKAKTLFLCSVADMQGETWGLDCAEHVEALLNHGMDGLLHAVCINNVPKTHDANTTSEMIALGEIDSETQTREFEATRVHEESPNQMDDPKFKRRVLRRVPVDDNVIARIKSEVPVLYEKQLADPVYPTWHSPRALGEVFKGVLELCHLPER